MRTEGALSVLIAADVDPVPASLGTEGVFTEHSRRLAARGHRVTVWARREHPEQALVEEVDGLRIYRHDFRGGCDARAFTSVFRDGARAYRQLVAGGGFDVLNAHQPLAACVLLKGAGRERPPLVYTFHAPWSQQHGTQTRRTGEPYRVRRMQESRLARHAHPMVQAGVRHHVEQTALSQSQRVMAFSRFSAQQLHEMHGIDLAAIDVIPVGVDTDRFRPVRDRLGLRRRLGLPSDRILLLAIRNPTTTARLDDLIEAIHFLRATQPEVVLIVGGATPPQDDLRLQVAALGLEKHVRFAGPIRELDLPGYYAAADLVVLPTHGVAGSGMTTVEALACGTPVVGTPGGPAPEVLRPLSSGLLFPGAGAGEMADWFRRHLPGVQQNVTLREQCRAYAARHFSWDTIMLQLELLFYEAASVSAEQGLDTGRSQPERPIAEP